MFRRRIPLKTLAPLCRSLGVMLDSGVPLLKVLDHASRKNVNAGCRRAMAGVVVEVRKGSELDVAFRNQHGYFPDLFIDMLSVAERSGSVPEVLRGLAEHYENLIRLRRAFLTAITWPVLQLIGAILVVALLILVLGLIAQTSGNQATDMLGWGLLGPSGALIWLAMSFGSLAGIIGSYFLVAKVFRQQRFLDGLLMRIPVLGGCMRAFAIARFSWAYAVTQQAGMNVVQSLDASLRATGNGAFRGAVADVCGMIREGEDLSTTLAQSGLFPEDYLHMVQVAESSGTVPEMLERLSPQFEDQARRSLQLLASALGWVVWAVVAVLIIYIIFSIMSRYIGMINELSGGS